MTPADGVRLGMFVGGSSDWLPVDEVLAAVGRDGRDAFVPAYTTISVVAAGREHAAGFSLGDLARVAAQLGPAADRLRAGQRALVRSAVEGVPEAVFVMLEPDDGEVVVVLGATDANPWAWWYPDDASVSDRLHDEVARHRDKMVARQPRFEPARLARDGVIADLRRDAEAGARLAERLAP